MNDSPKRWTTNCPTGKRRYESRSAAKKVLKQKPRTQRWRMDAYLCPECDGYHLGHLPKPVVRGEIGREDIIHPTYPKPRDTRTSSSPSKGA